LTPSSQISKKSVSRQGQLLREETYRYDAAGSPIVPGASYDHLMRPTGYHGEKFEYDEVGRLVSRLTDRGEWQYTWNSLDQLILVVAPGKRVEMDYDASSRRLRKRVIENGTLVKQEGYIWANNVVLHEVNELTGAVRTYLWDHSSWDRIGHVDVVDGEERVCFYVLKPAGGISHAIDADGRIVWQAEMSVFGECDPSVSDVPVSLRFANQHYDEDVELIYNRYRWYDPRLGMYVTTDPTFLEGTANPRDYVPNPLRWIDPMGLVAGGATAPSTTPSGGPAPTIDGTAAGAPYLSAPGAFATDGTPGTPGWVDCPANALHQGSGFGSETSTTSAQGIVNRAGDAYGCHSCGTMDSGYDTHYDKDGNPVQHWTCDHQPPRSTYNKTTSSKGGAVGAASNSSAGGAGAVRLYPHCKGCSNKQKTALSAASRAQDGRQNLAVMGLSQMSANQGVAF
ncbi:MAG: RHS repeat-associated core domain-containing protein, partial [Myxococcales bacterium]|nr:RHS repeat-associated core domain-containing protein [Myxococcales bacterium]